MPDNTPTTRPAAKEKPHDYGECHEVAAYLLDGPRTRDEIADHFHSYVRWIGLLDISDRVSQPERRGRLLERVDETLDQLNELGWVERQNERFALTELGQEQGQIVLKEVRLAAERMRLLTLPTTASKVSLVVHLGLAALKLPAALLSGSVGLLNDAVDTLLDGLSSLLVYAGMRYDKERAVSVVLVLLMLATGGYAFIEAVGRLIRPTVPEADWFTFTATILSAVICLALYLYQRFVGLRAASMALIAQSVDSKNHVIVAASVAAGLIASLLRFPLLDTLVGLVVAALILRSALELAIEVARSMGEEELDLSRYGMGLEERFNRIREKQMADWMLYQVAEQGVNTRDELLRLTREALDFGGNPMLNELGLADRKNRFVVAQGCLEGLFEQGLLYEEDGLHVTGGGHARARTRRENATYTGRRHNRRRKR